MAAIGRVAESSPATVLADHRPVQLQFQVNLVVKNAFQPGMLRSQSDIREA
jgi:hypothetical protein